MRGSTPDSARNLRIPRAWMERDRCFTEFVATSFPDVAASSGPSGSCLARHLLRRFATSNHDEKDWHYESRNDF
jgi:hypothetical protein